MKVIFISRSNLTAIIVIIAALLFAVLNAFLTKEYLTHASGSYKEDIPIYSVDTDEKNVPSHLIVPGEPAISQIFWISLTNTMQKPPFSSWEYGLRNILIWSSLCPKGDTR